MLYFLFMKKNWLVSTALENNETTLEVSHYQVDLFFDCCKLKLLHINLKAVSLFWACSEDTFTH